MKTTHSEDQLKNMLIKRAAISAQKTSHLVMNDVTFCNRVVNESVKTTIDDLLRVSESFSRL